MPEPAVPSSVPPPPRAPEPTGDGVVSEPIERNRDFRLVLVSQGISALGDAVTFTALPLLVLALTGSGVAMGLVAALQALSDLVFALPAGALADRGDRKRMMVGADIGRALLIALVPLSVFLGGPTMAVVLVIAAPMSILRSIFRAAYVASVPALVGRNRIARANAAFETVYSSAFLVGPAIAGMLAATVGPGPTLAIDAASFAVSAVGLLLVSRPLRAPADRPRTGMAGDIWNGVTFVARHPVLRAVLLLWTLAVMLFGPFATTLVYRLSDDLGQSAAAVGFTLTAYGLGAVVGALAATRIGQRAKAAPLLLGSLGAMGVSLVGAAVLDAGLGIVLMVVVFGIGESIAVVTYVTLRTAASPDDMLGRVGSVGRFASLGLQPVGMLAAGILIDTAGSDTALAAMGLGLCALVLAFWPIGALRSATLGPVMLVDEPGGPSPGALT